MSNSDLVSVVTLMSGVISSPTTGASFSRVNDDQWNYVATVRGTGAVSATVVIEVTLDFLEWLTWGTLSPSGTTTASDTIPAAVGAYPAHRARLSAISGTGAAVTVVAGGV